MTIKLETENHGKGINNEKKYINDAGETKNNEANSNAENGYKTV